MAYIARKTGILWTKEALFSASLLFSVDARLFITNRLSLFQFLMKLLELVRFFCYMFFSFTILTSGYVCIMLILIYVHQIMCKHCLLFIKCVYFTACTSCYVQTNLTFALYTLGYVHTISVFPLCRLDSVKYVCFTVCTSDYVYTMFILLYMHTIVLCIATIWTSGYV